MKCSAFIASLVISVAAIVCDRLLGEQPGNATHLGSSRSQEELRRQWLRTNLPKLVADKSKLNALVGQIENMNAGQVNDLVNLCLDELAARRRQQFALLSQANARERAVQAELARTIAAQRALGAGGPVGYYPVITWLPEGVSMSASAVVSPDRRSVRMSLAPFLSSIGPVHTFNFMTGETRRLPEFDPPSVGSQPTPPPRRDFRGR